MVDSACNRDYNKVIFTQEGVRYYDRYIDCRRQ